MTDLADALGDVAERAGTKVGPLPAWAWAGITAAGVGAVILIRRRSTGTVGAAPEADTAGMADTSAMSDMVAPSSPFVPGGFVIGSGPGTATGTTASDTPNRADPTDTGSVDRSPATNSEWQQLAARYLIGRGYQPTVTADALGRYVSGRTLTRQGQAIVDEALAAIGPTPAPVPPPVVSPAPEPVPSPGGGGTPTTPTPVVRVPTAVAAPTPVSTPPATATPVTRTPPAPPKPVVGRDIWPNGERPPANWKIARAVVPPGGSLWSTVQAARGWVNERLVRDTARRNNISLTGSGATLRANVQPGQVIYV